MNNQRARKSQLTEDRQKKLSDTGFVWDRFDENWEIGFSHLKHFRELEGHCHVPQNYKAEDGFRLGQWVSVQRQSKVSLSKERVHRLDELGFVWDSRQAWWDEGYDHLRLYKEREGHCCVPVKYMDADGFRFGQWVFEQRQSRKNLSEDRLQKLEKLGFDWDPLETAWMEGFQHLKSFKKREGHCLVPVAHIEEDYPLGRWVNRQRTAKGRMPPEHRQLLDELGFAWRVR